MTYCMLYSSICAVSPVSLLVCAMVQCATILSNQLDVVMDTQLVEMRILTLAFSFTVTFTRGESSDKKDVQSVSTL